jgi:hypothetical protein
MTAAHRWDRRALRDALLAARDAARAELKGWHAPLVLGRLSICGNCARFTFSTDTSGTCELHGDGLAPFLPFACPDFRRSSRPALPELLPSIRRVAGPVTRPLRRGSV